MTYNLDYVYEYNKEKLKNYCEIDHFSSSSLSVYDYNQACIIPRTKCSKGGVYHHGKHIELSMLHEGIDEQNYPEFDESNIDYVDSEVVYIGMFVNIWGHILTDNIKHLWFLSDNNFEYIRNLPFKYVRYNNGSLPESFFFILEKLGINRKQIEEITVPTKFKRVFLPDACFRNNLQLNKREYTNQYQYLINKIANAIPKCEEYDSVYFSRTGIHDFKDIGERYIEKSFSEKGYKIIYPEKLSFEQQISILKGCNHFVTTDGSIAHNCIFLKENSDCVIIRKADYLNGYQPALNQMRNLNVTYIDAHKSIMVSKHKEYGGPFFLYISNELAKYNQIKKGIFPICSFSLYIFLGLLRKVKRAL